MYQDIINSTSMEAIGGAIREMTGESQTYKPREMPDAIRRIGGGADTKRQLDMLKAIFENTAADIIVPNTVTKISNFGAATNYLSSVVRLIVPDSVTSIEHSFFYAPYLEVLVIGDGTTSVSGFTDVGPCKQIYAGKELTSVQSDSVLGAGASGGRVLFGGTKVQAEEIPSFSPAACECKISDDGNYVYVVGQEVKYSGGSDTGIGYAAYIGMESDVTVPRMDEAGSRCMIFAHAFAGRSCLKSVTLPNNIAEVCAHAFDGCANLTTVRFSNMPADGINRYAFENCEAITDIYVPWADGDVSGAPWGAPRSAEIHYNTKG